MVLCSRIMLHILLRVHTCHGVQVHVRLISSILLVFHLDMGHLVGFIVFLIVFIVL